MSGDGRKLLCIELCIINTTTTKNNCVCCVHEEPCIGARNKSVRDIMCCKCMPIAFFPDYSLSVYCTYCHYYFFLLSLRVWSSRTLRNVIHRPLDHRFYYYPLESGKHPYAICFLFTPHEYVLKCTNLQSCIKKKNYISLRDYKYIYI